MTFVVASLAIATRWPFDIEPLVSTTMTTSFGPLADMAYHLSTTAPDFDSAQAAGCSDGSDMARLAVHVTHGRKRGS